MNLIDTLPVDPELYFVKPYITYNPTTRLDQTWYQYTPVISFAVEKGLTNVAIRLIQKGYSYKLSYTDRLGWTTTVLKFLVDNNKYDIIRAILAKEPSILSELITKVGLLSKTTQNDTYLDMTKYLIDSAGVPLETLDKYKFTPLTMAAYSGAFETVKYLCSKGADPTKGAVQQAKNPVIKQYLEELCRAPPPAAAAPVVAAPVAPPVAATRKKANKPVKAKSNTRPAGSNTPPARANTRPAGSNAPPARPNNKTRRRKRGPRKRGQTKKNTAAP
jgi:hypothetical protein